MSYGRRDRNNQNQNEDPLESEGMRKMFIGGIARSTTVDQLADHFGQFGTIVDKVIIMDPQDPSKSRGFGFVTYESSSSVEECFKERPHNIDGKELDIKRAIPRDLPENAHSKTKKLFVGGVGEDMTPEELQEYIESRHPPEYGTILKYDFLKNRDTGKNKGFGFLECSSQEFADRLTICEQHFHYKGKKMGIKKAEPKPGEEPQGFGGGRGGGRGGMGGGRGGGRGGMRGGRGGGGGGGGFVANKEGDWTCKLCNNSNFARRTECNKCKTARAECEAQGGSQQGGGGYATQYPNTGYGGGYAQGGYGAGGGGQGGYGSGYGGGSGYGNNQAAGGYNQSYGQAGGDYGGGAGAYGQQGGYGAANGQGQRW